VVTCAHVLDKQFGRPEPGHGPAAPVEVVEVEFPFVDEPGPAVKRKRAKVVGWAPITADGSGDVALLELESELDLASELDPDPELDSHVAYTPAPLACPPALSGHQFSVHGFPDGDPATRHVTGVLRGASGPNGPWVQLDPEGAAGWAVELGFSGAPIFDQSAEAVVGIVVLRDKHRTGHMLPMSYLRTLWPQVRTNCRWRLDLAASYGTHWLPRARGLETDSGTDEWFFSGRAEARRVIRDWLEGKDLAEYPILLVTGGPGTGKSALLAHSLVASDPLLARAVPTPGPHPPTGAFDVAVHLKERTRDEAAAQLADALGVAASSADELLAAVGRFPRGKQFTVLADAVEEATSLRESLQIATMLRQLANTGRVRVLAAVRTAPADSDRARILSNLGRSAPRIDLEDSRYLHRPDIAKYVERRLTSEQTGSARYHAYEPSQRRTIGETVARKSRYNFLIAQLTTGWLIARSKQDPDLDDPSWEDELPETVGQALDAYLDACGPDSRTIRRLLTALAFARGDGLPRSDTWLQIANALGRGTGYTGRDLEEVFDSAAHYLVERVSDGSGSHMYRLYHDALDQHLREWCVHDAPEAAITTALTKDVSRRDGERDWSAAEAYTCDHLAGHAAAAGQLDALLSDAEYLVHATPRHLTRHLQHTQTNPAQLTAAIYRTSVNLHATATPAVRRQILALDAARAGAVSLQTQLIDGIREGQWAPRWATGADFDPALRDTLTGHTSYVSAVSCSSLDGTPIAVTTSHDLTVRVWDLASCTPLGSPMEVGAISTPPVACTVVDGNPVAVTGGDLRVWDLASCTPLGPVMASSVSAVACTILDGKPVAVTGERDRIRVWDLASRSPLGPPMTARRHRAQSVACTSLDGRPIAVTGGTDGTVRVWDLTYRTPLGSPITINHPVSLGPGATEVNPVQAVACTALNGRPVVLIGGGDGSVWVWDLASLTALGPPMTGHTKKVYSVVCTVLDGRPVVVSGGAEGTIRVWDLASRAPIGPPITANTGAMLAVDCSFLDGVPVAVAGGPEGTLRVWDLASLTPLGQPMAGHTDSVRAVACTSLNGAPVAITGGYDRTVRVWNIASGSPIGPPITEYSGSVTALECTSLYGAPIAVTGYNDGTVRVWDVASGTAIVPPIAAHEDLTALTCTALNGRPVAVTFGVDYSNITVENMRADTALDPIARVWDLLSGALLSQPAIKCTNWAKPVCATVDDRPIVITVSEERTVRAWDLASGNPLGPPLTGYRSTVTAVGYALLDGVPVVVTGEGNGTVRVWDLASGTPLGQPLIGHTGPVYTVVCATLNGEPVAVTAGDHETVRVWNLRTREAAGLIAATGATTVAVSAEGHLVVGMGRDVAAFTWHPRGRAR
jgi:WD40 repeat protein